jgi:sugar phosphate isomerase/epimerase
MEKLKFSFFQFTFGPDESFLHPEATYQRLNRFGYDAIEISLPKGRYSPLVKMEKYVEAHQKLKDEYSMTISCINDCWGEKWDPHVPNYKTLTEKKSADFAVAETKTSLDVAAELKIPFVAVVATTHGPISRENAGENTAIAVDALRQMSDYARKKDVRLVFEAVNHLEMGKYINTVANHRRLIELAGCDNIGIQIDCFHANIEELNPYEAVIDAGSLLWHMHFRDSNSLTPGYGTVDFKSVIRAMKKIGYTGYCTVECVPMFPDSDTACRDGIEYLKLLERIVDNQLSSEYPNGYAISL